MPHKKSENIANIIKKSHNFVRKNVNYMKKKPYDLQKSHPDFSEGKESQLGL